MLSSNILERITDRTDIYCQFDIIYKTLEDLKSSDNGDLTKI